MIVRNKRINGWGRAVMARMREKRMATQKRPTQRVKPVSAPQPAPKASEPTAAEVLIILQRIEHRRAQARIYQRGYYKRNRAKILKQRKARAKKATAKP